MIKGQPSSWDLEENLDDAPSAKYTLTIPAGFETTNIATLIVRRDGGETPADLRFRQALFTAIGSVTAAGGQVEAGLKRLLLILRGRGTEFSLVDETWAALEKKLRGLPAAGNPQHTELVAMLDWSKRKRLRERRHDVVHGSWWLYDGIGARVSRWPRNKAEGDFVLISSVENVQQTADQCWEYVDRIHTLIGDRWPRAVLPAPELPEPFRRN